MKKINSSANSSVHSSANSNKTAHYNKTGFYVFLFSIGFSCLWAFFFLFFKNRVELGEYDKTEPSLSLPEALSQEEMDRPWISTEWLIAQGKKVYAVQCALCHGPKGLGDGNPALIPPPRNLVEGDWQKGGSSKELFLTFEKGIEGTSMASFKHLSKLDRWALVHYVRSITDNKVPDDPKELEEFGPDAP